MASRSQDDAKGQWGIERSDEQTAFFAHARIPEPGQGALIAGARDREPVRGLTHDFYKYPARFSPSFVRAAVETFTRPGELVLDNHVGGGITLVEALALGRDAIGVDISPLAEFVTALKPPCSMRRNSVVSPRGRIVPPKRSTCTSSQSTSLPMTNSAITENRQDLAGLAGS
jgi:DNA methylase